MNRLNHLNRLNLALVALLVFPAAVRAEVDSELKPGVLLKERAQLKLKLNQAKAQGIGTGGYEAAFNAMEQSVGANASEAEINSKVSSLSTALDAQLDRAKTLKSQHPTAPISSHSRAPSGFSSAPGGFGSAPGPHGPYGTKVIHQTGDTFESISAKIKESQDRDAAMFKNNGMDSPQMRELIKNLKDRK